MCTLLDEVRPVARKPHGCNECGGTIGSGDTYLRQRIVDCGDIWTYKAHRLCNAIGIRWQREFGFGDCDILPDWGEMRSELHRVFAGLCAWVGHPDMVMA